MNPIRNQCGECSCEVTTYENGMRQISKIKWDCIDPACPYFEMNLIRGKPITEYSRNMTLCLGDTAVRLNRKDAYDQIWNAIINQVNND